MEERWDIYDKNKQLTGRTMKRNDWTLKDDEYHLTVLGVIRRSDGKFLIIYLKSKVWTITRLKNSSGVYGGQYWL